MEGLNFVEDLAKFGPTRLQTDPVGFFKDAAGMVAGEAPLVGLGPDVDPVSASPGKRWVSRSLTGTSGGQTPTKRSGRPSSTSQRWRCPAGRCRSSASWGALAMR